MRHTFPHHLIFGLGGLAVAACGDGGVPTQPRADVVPEPAAAVAVLAPDSWVLKAPYPSVFGAVGPSAGAVTNGAGQSVVYTLGGTDKEGGSEVSVASYNVATNVWSIRSREPRVGNFNNNGVGLIGNLLYFSGGESFGPSGPETWANLFAYDPAGNTLTRKADMPKHTADGVTAVINGLLYVLPGLCGGEGFPTEGFCEVGQIRQLFRYNPAADHWVSKRSAPHYHPFGAGGAINGKFYVAGGSGPDGNTLDAYDPASDSWKTLAPLPVGGVAHGAVIQGKLFVIVSVPTGDGQFRPRAFAYDPATNHWIAKAAPKRVHDAVVLVRLGGNPRLLGVGGVHSDSTGMYVVNQTELYTP
jgi:N-acetylneuraminic acid mutarotase